MTPHEKACADYVIASAEVKRLTRLIGISITDCQEAKAKEAGEDPEYCQIPHCLSDYYHGMNTALNIGLWAETPEFPDCQHCKKTDVLIRQRKKARATLGAAKRQITILGRKLIKESQS